MDWPTVFAHIKLLAEARQMATTAGSAETRRKLASARRKVAGRILLGIGVVLILLAIRQWYFGGTIPFVREPEKFRVGTIPEGEKETRH